MHLGIEASTNTIAAIANVSLRQLQWWDEKRIVSPLLVGHHRVWDETSAFYAVLLGKLRARHISLQRCRRVIWFLNRFVRKTFGYLIIGPRDILIVASEHEVVATLTGLQSGAHVIDLAAVMAELKEQLVAPTQRW